MKTYQFLAGFAERSAEAVHAVVEATGVAQVMTCAVPSPQRSGQ